MCGTHQTGFPPTLEFNKFQVEGTPCQLATLATNWNNAPKGWAEISSARKRKKPWLACLCLSQLLWNLLSGLTLSVFWKCVVKNYMQRWSEHCVWSVLQKVTKVSVSEHFLRELEMFKSFLVRSGTAD